MTAPAGYASPPAASRITGVIPSCFTTSGKAATPAQPSATPTAADNHFGAATQQSLRTTAAAAPDHTLARVVIRHDPWRLINPTGVYVPAISKKIPAWSARRIHSLAVVRFHLTRW